MTKKKLTNNSRLFILTAAHNNLNKTKLFLKSLSNKKNKAYQLFFVDDGSTDGTQKYIQKYFPKTILLKGDGNLWWGGSMHLGISKILDQANDQDLILIINNDTEFDADYLSKVMSEYKKFKKTIIGSLALDSERKEIIWDGGVKINWPTGRIYGIQPTGMNINSVKLKKKNIEDRIDTLSTKGTIYSVKLFREIGNFNKEKLPHYFSDYEINYRAKQAGYKLILDYNLKVYNDIKTTGIGEELKPPLNLSNLLNLLFSRRSRMNITDHYQFVTICCPSQYKLKNYLVVTLRMLYLISLTAPFFYLHQIFSYFRKLK